MRLILLIAVVALGIDALVFSGAYTQSAWRTLSGEIEELAADISDRPILDQTSTGSTEKPEPADAGDQPQETRE